MLGPQRLRSPARAVSHDTTPGFRSPIQPSMGALEIAATGMRSAEVRLGASAHNVANLTTADFRPLRTVQTALEGGGSVAVSRQEAQPREVDYAREVVEQLLAASQFRASLRVFAVAAENDRHLVDLLA